MDVVDKKTRSRMMTGIKSKDTKPEILVRKFLHKQGFGYRLHVRELPGCPDIVLRKYNIVIFVHGCFWHRHKGCRLSYTPKSNTEKWQNKFKENIHRDEINIGKLLNKGWRVLVIWECALKSLTFDLTWLPNYIISDEKTYWEYSSFMDTCAVDRSEEV